MTMRHDNPRRDSAPVLLVALIGFTVLVAAVTFVLSFHGLDDYGRRVAGLSRLSPLVPVGVDGLTLVAVSATSILRHAPLHVRAYAWFVFAISVGLSVAGNLSHAIADNLTWQGEIGSAAWPMLLAVASHLVIVTLRARERQRDAQDEATPATDDAPSERQAPAPTVARQRVTANDTTATEPATDVAPRVTTPRVARQRQPKASAVGDTAAAVRKLWRANKSHAEIALALGISKKTAERHTEPLRRATADNATDDASEREPVAVGQ